MSAMEIDKPLEEIIASRPKTSRGGRGGARRGAGAGRPAAAAGGAGNNARARYAGAAPAAASPAAKGLKATQAEAVKVIISNLPTDVDESQIRDLMQSTVGPVKSVQLVYNRNGTSTGTATVIFKDKGHGNKAHAAYNNRMIDNKRPMKVEIVFDPAKVSLSQRVAPAPVQAAKPARGGAAPKRGGRAPKAPRPAPKTVEELDAEMAAYKTTA